MGASRLPACHCGWGIVATVTAVGQRSVVLQSGAIVGLVHRCWVAVVQDDGTCMELVDGCESCCKMMERCVGRVLGGQVWMASSRGQSIVWCDV